MIAINAYNKKDSSLKLLRANQKVETKERDLVVEKLNTLSQQKLTKRNFVILLVGILLVISLLSFWFRNKYLLNKQQIRELALANTKKALIDTKSQLKNMATRVRQDNNLIIELQKQKISKNTSILLSKLKSKNILTKDGWTQFQSLFKAIHPHFISYIKASNPNLSQAEIRCLCLEKFILTNNEMGLLLGVLTNTIRVTKHRIRKKLNLQSQDDLGKFVQNFRTDK
ncbi:helix-turn-helix transcriptional regulator [Polaribacter sp. IC073]|uniref:helix-turn-helix transcriptional regulator n=1 Tax=Polaribacter sp. IC073 TaxID=2508540 RepID=UPI0011BDACE1|nr:hypothetical protein [Polaribacter sp. IC073]TXD48716.1 hypothetical protein ES045_05700 [Polaribacter sp. IC073]